MRGDNGCRHMPGVVAAARASAERMRGVFHARQKSARRGAAGEARHACHNVRARVEQRAYVQRRVDQLRSWTPGLTWELAINSSTSHKG